MEPPVGDFHHPVAVDHAFGGAQVPVIPDGAVVKVLQSLSVESTEHDGDKKTDRDAGNGNGRGN